jgi:putative flippase GtrA
MSATAKNTVKIVANLCRANALCGMRGCAPDVMLGQTIDGERVALHWPDGNSLNDRDFAEAGSCNSFSGNDMQALARRAADSLSVNLLVANRLRGFSPRTAREKATENAKNLTGTATLVRWCKFNLVGAVGIFVQFGVLFLLKSVLHFNYLAATALAVEVAVVHNFFWHERFTWADRTKSRPSLGRHASGAETRNRPSTLFAALKRFATQRLCCLSLPRLSLRGPSLCGLSMCRLSLRGGSFARFVRFNLTTGLVSIAGNLGMMQVMVGRVHMNYLAANGIAIAVCSLLNFVVSDGWVFGTKTLLPRICTDRHGFRS